VLAFAIGSGSRLTDGESLSMGRVGCAVSASRKPLGSDNLPDSGRHRRRAHGAQANTASMHQCRRQDTPVLCGVEGRPVWRRPSTSLRYGGIPSHSRVEAGGGWGARGSKIRIQANSTLLRCRPRTSTAGSSSCSLIPHHCTFKLADSWQHSPQLRLRRAIYWYRQLKGKLEGPTA